MDLLEVTLRVIATVKIEVPGAAYLSSLNIVLTLQHWTLQSQVDVCQGGQQTEYKYIQTESKLEIFTSDVFLLWECGSLFQDHV